MVLEVGPDAEAEVVADLKLDAPAHLVQVQVGVHDEVAVPVLRRVVVEVIAPSVEFHPVGGLVGNMQMGPDHQAGVGGEGGEITPAESAAGDAQTVVMPRDQGRESRRAGDAGPRVLRPSREEVHLVGEGIDVKLIEIQPHSRRREALMHGKEGVEERPHGAGEDTHVGRTLLDGRLGDQVELEMLQVDGPRASRRQVDLLEGRVLEVVLLHFGEHEDFS